MDTYRGVDYYGIEALLTEEQRMVRDAVRDWVEKEFVPVVADHHRAGTFPLDVAKPLGESVDVTDACNSSTRHNP